METAHIGQKYIGTSIVKLLDANEKRTAILIKNNSANIVYVCRGPDDTTSTGMPIAAAGTYSNEHNQGEIWLVASGADSDVRYEEDAC